MGSAPSILESKWTVHVKFCERKRYRELVPFLLSLKLHKHCCCVFRFTIFHILTERSLMRKILDASQYSLGSPSIVVNFACSLSIEMFSKIKVRNLFRE